MKKFTYFDDSFDISHTNNYEVTIQFGLNGYSFCVNSLLDNKCVAVGKQEFGGTLPLNDLPKRLISFLDSQEFLSKNFSKVNFIYTTVKGTLAPKGFHEKNKLKELFNFNHVLSPDENLEKYVLSSNGAAQIFASPASLATIMINRYKDVNFCHQISALLDSFVAQTSAKDAKAEVLINFTDELIDIVVAEQQKLVLHNTYEIGAAEDALYYIVNTFKQLELDTKSTPVYVAGNIEDGDVMHNLLKDIFSLVKFYLNLNKAYNLSPAKHQFASLINF